MNRGKKLETEDMYNGIERYASTVTHQPLRINRYASSCVNCITLEDNNIIHHIV